MRYLLIIFILIFIGRIGVSQNLVYNGSFEQLKSCNNLGGGGLDSATGWWDVGTGDVLNTCSIIPNYLTPNNVYGYQLPFDGDGYAYFANYAEPPFPTDIREYAQTKLLDTLQIGIKYYVSFRVSLADNLEWASDGIGAFFSIDSVFGVGIGNMVDSIPQIEVPVGIPIIDSVNWTLVEGSFIANGNESYLTIGNFKTDAQVTLQNMGGSAKEGGYYLDGVCVSVDSLTCYNFVGIKDELTQQQNFNIYPNPVTNELLFITDVEFEQLEIIDVSGKKVKSITNNSYAVDVSALPKGIYLIRLIGRNNVLTRKFVKN